MNWSHVSHVKTAGIEASHETYHSASRVDPVLIALIIAAVLGALSSIYFGVNAGADYPEPWTQVTD